MEITTLHYLVVAAALFVVVASVGLWSELRSRRDRQPERNEIS